MQFIQRYLSSSTGLVWLAASLERWVTLDSTQLFCIYSKFESEMVPLFFFYSVFRVWSFYKCHKDTTSESLFGFLEEPVIYGARLDVSTGAPLGLPVAILHSSIFFKSFFRSFNQVFTTTLYIYGVCCNKTNKDNVSVQKQRWQFNYPEKDAITVC